MYLKRFPRLFLCLFVLGSVSYQPSVYSWKIDRDYWRQAYQSAKTTLIGVAKQIAPALIADGILLGVELIFNRCRAGAFGDQEEDGKDTLPMPVPADKGLIAPGTVPLVIDLLIRVMKERKQFLASGAILDKGVILAGGTGVGKTELGYYIARQTGSLVVCKKAASLIKSGQGSGAAAIRTLFDNIYYRSVWSRFKSFVARIFWRPQQEEKPVVLILDEIDAIGGTRQAVVTDEERAREDERKRALLQLMGSIDTSQEQGHKLFVVGTTNMPRKLFDKALIRDERLPLMRMPSLTKEHRLKILTYHASRLTVPLAAQINLAKIARRSKGYSGSSLRGLLNKALVYAVDRESPQVEQRDFTAAWRDKQGSL